MPGIARAALRGAAPAPGPAGGFGRSGAALAPSPARSAWRRGAAPTMRGCPRLALLCALPWLLRAAAPGHPAQPPARRHDPRDPARGADFDRVYSGVVNLSTENIYSFNYTSRPGQVRHSLDSQGLARSQSSVAALVPWESTSGDRRDQGGLSFPSPSKQSLPCPSCRILRNRFRGQLHFISRLPWPGPGHF